MSFLGEIKRRKMFQVAAVYAVVAWLLVQIIVAIEAPLHLPDWVDTLVIVLLAVGFPIILLLSWSLNLTPEGLVKEGEEVSASGSSLKIEYVLLGVIGVALIWLVYRVEFDGSQQAAVTSASTDKPEEFAAEESPSDILPNSIAVLPFENLSLDPEDEFFAAGIHDSTLNQLAKISGLTVLSRTSVLKYSENQPTIPEIANELNVAMIMEGSVRYAGGRVLITVQLIDGKTDAHLWSAEFNRELTDVFAVQAEVAQQIASQMKVQISPEEEARLAARPTDSSEAYSHYLQALGFPRGRDYSLAHKTSLERAISADPEFAEAHVALAWVYNYYGNIDEAIRAAERAIELDPTLGRAYQVLGAIAGDYYDRQDESFRLFDLAINLSPSDPEVLSQSCYRMADDSDKLEQAIPLCRRAVAIEPENSSAYRRLGFVLFRAGQLEEAAQQTNKAIEFAAGRRSFEPYLNLAIIEYVRGDRRASLNSLDQALRIMSTQEVFRVDYIAYLYGLLGQPETAEELLAQFNENFGESERAAGRTLGWGFLGTRNKERALENWTETVNGYIEDGWPVSPGRISRFRDNWLNDPMLEEPEFVELRRRLGYEG